MIISIRALRIFVALTVFIVSNFVFKVSNAMIFDEHTYGRARGYIGGAVQFSKVSRETDKNFSNFIVLLGAGYNLYFNIYEFLHPFIGIEMQGRIPTVKRKYNVLHEYTFSAGEKRYYDEVFLAHLKLGTRLVVNYDISYSPYGLIGFSVSRIKTTMFDFHKIENTVGISAGIGCEMTIKDLFLIAVEYRYSEVEKSIAKIENHNIEIKFGVEFL